MLSACSPESPAPESDARTLSVAFQSPPDNLDPFRSRTSRASSLFEHTLGLALLVLDPATGETMPWLADAPPSITAMGARWTIRGGARWDDGRPVTSRDFVATFEACRGLGGELGRAAAAIAGTTELVLIDEHTFEQRFETAAAVERFGRGFVVLPAKTSAAPRGFDPPPLCGPYRVVERDSGRLVLAKKTQWWAREDPRFADAYPFARVIHRYVADESTALRMMSAGDVDLLGVSARATIPRDMKLRTFHLPGFSFIGWNNADAVLRDPQLRSALSLTIPRARINAQAFDGAARIVDDPLDVLGDAGELVTFDARTAGKLLDQHGLADVDGDGLRDHGGSTFVLDLVVPAGELPWVDAIVAAWSEVLDQIGIELNVTRLATAALVQSLRDGAFDAFLVVWTVNETRPTFRALLHSDEIGGRNFQRTADPDLDAAIEDLENDRPDAAARFERIIVERRPITTLFQHPSRLCWNPRRVSPEVGHRGLFFPYCRPPRAK